MENNKSTIRRIVLLFCYYINLLMIILFFIIIIAALLRMQSFLDYIFFDETFINIRMILTVPIFVLWINNIIIWSKHDKHIGRFFLLFFLIGVYSPFYFRKILRNKWQ